MKDLLLKYEMPGGLVNYSCFCNEIDSVFGNEDAMRATQSMAQPKFTADEQNVIFKTLSDLRQIIKANRILLKPSFQDFDPANTQHISVHQFGRVLKQMQLMPEESVFEIVCRNYMDKSTREINYAKFCHDVDRPEEALANMAAPAAEADALPKASLSMSNFFSGSTKGVNVLENRFLRPAINISNDPSDVEDRLRSLVVMKRVRVNEFFRDFDKLRKGKVTRSQFKAILATLNFTLTDEEYQFLIDKYAAEDEMVNYAAFVDSIDSAFTQKGIEKVPTAKVAPVNPSTTLKGR